MARLMTPTEYAKHRGVSRQAVYKALGRRIKRGPGGLIDADQADDDWDANTDPTKPSSSNQDTAGGPEPPAGARSGDGGASGSAQPPGPSLSRVKTARESLEVQLRQIKVRQLRGELVSVAEVKVAAYQHAKRARDALVGLPGRVAPLLAPVTDQAECYRILTEHVAQICEELHAPMIDPAADPAEELREHSV